MRIATDVLSRFIDAPADIGALRLLLDDVGLEVKRVEDDGDHTVFALELLANRGDHHCYEGVARELNGRLGKTMCGPSTASLDVGNSPHPIRINTPLCLRYSLTLLERRTDSANGAVGAAAGRVLQAAGLQSVSAVVDATNVSNLELGQPTHAFDADTVVGPVTIRTTGAGERCWPLFRAEPVELPEGTLVIADDEKILAVAGVIGCEESKATDASTRILLESACFDPVAVRKASRALTIHTDSSARFERGSDPERVLTGAGRVVQLLEEAGWERVGSTGLMGDHRDPGRVVTLEVSAAAAFLSVPLDASEIQDRLGRYGFTVRSAENNTDQLHVTVPSWRAWDVEFAADLYEELAKSIGYNATPIDLPPVRMGAAQSHVQRRKEQVEEVLLGNGFYEVFTDGFYGRQVLERLGIQEDHALFRHVETANALDRGYSLLKNNALAQAVEAIGINERRRTMNVKLYEWTRTFHPMEGILPKHADTRQPPCRERPLLWAIVSGDDRAATWAKGQRAADVLYVKGLVEELAVELGLDLSLGAANDSHPLSMALHPGRQAVILLDGETVGVVGEVHPDVLDRAKIKRSRPTYLEIDRVALFAEGSRAPFVEPASTQPVVRSLAFTLPHRVEAGAVAAWLHASGSDDLLRVHVVDVYNHPEGARTVTFELTWGDATVSADATNQALQALIDAVQAQFGDAGVMLR